ncbi:hypothetical protein ACLOJK_021326 [Asimina triloba]
MMLPLPATYYLALVRSSDTHGMAAFDGQLSAYPPSLMTNQMHVYLHTTAVGHERASALLLGQATQAQLSRENPTKPRQCGVALKPCPCFVCLHSRAHEDFVSEACRHVRIRISYIWTLHLLVVARQVLIYAVGCRNGPPLLLFFGEEHGIWMMSAASPVNNHCTYPQNIPVDQSTKLHITARNTGLHSACLLLGKGSLVIVEDTKVRVREPIKSANFTSDRVEAISSGVFTNSKLINVTITGRS